jgi:hypothetical protein
MAISSRIFVLHVLDYITVWRYVLPRYFSLQIRRPEHKAELHRHKYTFRGPLPWITLRLLLSSLLLLLLLLLLVLWTSIIKFWEFIIGQTHVLLVKQIVRYLKKHFPHIKLTTDVITNCMNRNTHAFLWGPPVVSFIDTLDCSRIEFSQDVNQRKKGN